MGVFYGAAHVRMSDRDTVCAAAEELALGRGIRCLVGPVLGEWVSVYPSNNGQDQTVGQELARRLNCDVLHLLVHDDDVLIYYLYRKAELADSYWSLPGYFAERDRDAQQAMAGRPESWADLLGDQVGPVRDLLKRETEGGESYVCEVDRLTRLAKLVGITNAVTAYEYLKDGESEGIKGRRQFIEVPQAEIAKQKQTERALAAEIKRKKKELMKQGLFLAEQHKKDCSHPAWCVVEDGFWLYLKVSDPRAPQPMQHFRSQTADIETIDLELPEHAIWDLKSSHSGRYVAVEVRTFGQAKSGVGVYDTAQKCWLWKKAVCARLAGFDSAEKRLLIFDNESAELVNPADGKSVTPPQATHGAVNVALHPNGREVVLNEQTRLVAFDFDDPSRQIAMYPGGKIDFQTRPRIDRILRTLQHGLPQRMASLREQMPTLSDEDLQKKLQTFRDDLLSERIAPPDEANVRVHRMVFSRDGERLYCGTREGLFAYSWDIMKTGGTPSWTFPTVIGEPLANGASPRCARLIVEDERHQAILFAGDDGIVRIADQRTGSVTTLLAPPDDMSVMGLGLTPAADALCVTLLHNSRDSDRKKPDHALWQVWSYAKLREQAGLSM